MTRDSDRLPTPEATDALRSRVNGLRAPRYPGGRRKGVLPTRQPSHDRFVGPAGDSKKASGSEERLAFF